MTCSRARRQQAAPSCENHQPMAAQTASKRRSLMTTLLSSARQQAMFRQPRAGEGQQLPRDTPGGAPLVPLPLMKIQVAAGKQKAET